jgi:hypothetical protein
MTKSQNEDYELFKQLHESKGMNFLNRLKIFSFSFQIFGGNLNELREGLTLIENPKLAIQLWKVENREHNVQAHRDITRLLHNFLAGAKTLIDHSRVFVNNYYKQLSFAALYQEKVKSTFTGDPLSAFIQYLRNYILHKGPLPTSMSLTIKPNEPLDHAIYLDVDKLKEWKKWSSNGRLYLEQQPSRLKLLTVVESYSNAITNFYRWFETELCKVHAAEILEFELLQERYAAISKDR